MPFAPRRAFAHLALSAALALTAGAAGAQAPINPFGFGLSAGAAVPVGDAGDAFDVGFSVDGIVTLRVPTLPVSFRGEFGYTRFGVKGDALDDEDAASGIKSNFRILSGVANVVLGFPASPTAVIRPYLIAGVGAYNGRTNVSADGLSVSADAGTKLGLNGGAGFEIPLSGITGFGEVRYTSIFTEERNTNYVPIRFGIRF